MQKNKSWRRANVTAAKGGKTYARMFRFFLLNFDHERENLAQDFKVDAKLKQCKRSSFQVWFFFFFALTVLSFGLLSCCQRLLLSLFRIWWFVFSRKLQVTCSSHSKLSFQVTSYLCTIGRSAGLFFVTIFSDVTKGANDLSCIITMTLWAPF